MLARPISADKFTLVTRSTVFYEYFRRLLARDLARPEAGTDVHHIFDLGNSGGSDIARDKDAMIAEAVGSSRRKRR